MIVVLWAYFVNGMFHDVSAVPMANMTLFFMAGVTAGLRPWIRKYRYIVCCPPEMSSAMPTLAVGML